MQERIFESFGQVDGLYTRPAEGTGLGLPLVRLLVNALGGRILLESHMGEGSTFTVLLPSAKVNGSSTNNIIEPFTDHHLASLAAIEFSDIYF